MLHEPLAGGTPAGMRTGGAPQVMAALRTPTAVTPRFTDRTGIVAGLRHHVRGTTTPLTALGVT